MVKHVFLLNFITMNDTFVISSLYDCMVNIKLKYNFVETTRKFMIDKQKLLLMETRNISKFQATKQESSEISYGSYVNRLLSNCPRTMHCICAYLVCSR